MARYYVTFHGRRRGRPGATWQYARIVTAGTPTGAIMECENTHDGITGAEVREVDDAAPALPHDRARLRAGAYKGGCGHPCAVCYELPGDIFGGARTWGPVPHHAPKVDA